MTDLLSRVAAATAAALEDRPVSRALRALEAQTTEHLSTTLNARETASTASLAGASDLEGN